MIKTGSPLISIYTEMTPNPETMKFVANKLLYPGKSIDFPDVETAKPSPLAVELFGFPFIKAVFIASNFVTLTKNPETDWNDVTSTIRQFLKEYLEEGKAVTNDILFDVNSDVIKQSSYSIIDQLGDALSKNASVRVLIVGHTDSDGAAAHNLELSKKRAAAVKNYLTTHFNLDDSRLQSDGKGATQPVAPNTTDAGKAKNRRVEFVKL